MELSSIDENLSLYICKGCLNYLVDKIDESIRERMKNEL